MNRLDNLGDYNIVRDDLYEHGGDAAALYKDIADTAVAEQAPALIAFGALIALIADFGIRRGIAYWKNRKQLLEKKPILEQQLVEHIHNEPQDPDELPIELSNLED